VTAILQPNDQKLCAQLTPLPYYTLLDALKKMRQNDLSKKLCCVMCITNVCKCGCPVKDGHPSVADIKWHNGSRKTILYSKK